MFVSCCIKLRGAVTRKSDMRLSDMSLSIFKIKSWEIMTFLKFEK